MTVIVMPVRCRLEGCREVMDDLLVQKNRFMTLNRSLSEAEVKDFYQWLPSASLREPERIKYNKIRRPAEPERF
jgi:hypothetical protein